MILNYEAFTHPKGECFRFSAKDDDDARRLIEDFLLGTNQFRASVFRWVDESTDPDTNMYERSREIKILLPEKARSQTEEYKLETRYIRWVKISAVAGEEAFSKAAKNHAESLDSLPEQPGWEKKFSSQHVHYTDDEQYGANVEEISLDGKL